MLNVGQINLLVHLKRFGVADKDTCLLALDSDKTQNKDKLLYSLRPLVKNGYMSKRSDGLYGLLQDGTDVVPHIEQIIAVGGDADGRRRVAEVSHMAALLDWYGIPTLTAIPSGGQNGFIPSAIWRNLRSGLISTTRFLGVLFYNKLRLAVYHVGDGNYHWQLRPECSLQYWRHDNGVSLTGILLVCNDGLAADLGEKIIRRTLWERKTLLKQNYYGNSKRVSFSRMPIRVRVEYKHVYLANESEIIDILQLAGKQDSVDLLYMAKYYNETGTRPQ